MIFAQAFTTKYLGPTNTKGARISVTCHTTGKRKTVSYAYELSGACCHEHAVKQAFPEFARSISGVGVHYCETMDRKGYIFTML